MILRILLILVGLGIGYILGGFLYDAVHEQSIKACHIVRNGNFYRVVPLNPQSNIELGLVCLKLEVGND